MALSLHDDMLCECGCGYYRDICQSDDMDGRYEVVADEVVCHVKAAVDEAREGTRVLEPGALVFVRPRSGGAVEDQ